MKGISDEKDFDKIKVFSSDDEKLKILGELLSNKSSRNIIRLLIEKEMYTNEIAKKLGLRVNLVIHHLQKLEKLGLVEVRNKKIVKKGNEHRHFKMIPNLFIVPNYNEERRDKKEIFKNFFKDGLRYCSIVIVASLLYLYQSNDGLDIKHDDYFYPLVVIIVGLIIEIIIVKKRKRFRIPR